ncbi:MAG: hypothetical protein RL252_644, partial [Actinomycetota bacterium]
MKLVNSHGDHDASFQATSDRAHRPPLQRPVNAHWHQQQAVKACCSLPVVDANERLL